MQCNSESLQCNSLPSFPKKRAQSWPKEIRLTKGWEYDFVFRTGTRTKGKLVRLLYVKTSESETSRFGFAVGKRMGKAYLRNRGRRILKEALRRLKDDVKPGYYFILSLSEEGLKASSVQIYDDICALFYRRGFFSDERIQRKWK